MKPASDSIFDVSLCAELGSLESKTVETEFQRELDKSRVLLTSRYFDPLWKLKRYFNTRSAKETMNSVRIVDDYGYKLIQTKAN